MGLIAVISKVWNNRIDQNQLSLNKVQEKEWIGFTTLSDQIVFLEGLKFKESVLQSLLKSQFVVALSCLFNSISQFI
jgi:hypothetical protein